MTCIVGIAENGKAFLLGYRGSLYHIGADYQVGRSIHGFDACGCGDQIAKGSLFSTGADPVTRINIALAAAEMFSAGVRSPYLVESIGG